MIGTTVSHYQILEMLGHGGMGVVYKALDLKLDRFVALKFLPKELTPLEGDSDRRRRDRFIQEAKASSALDHPNIATLHEIGETEGGDTFLVMAYYEGETLKNRIARGPLPLEAAVSLAGQIADGLGKAHDRGIVHRDVKPANVIVTIDGVVKIIDFGLAMLTEATRMTRPGTAIGTPAYMSPEQARGDEIDPRTDLWSLGVVLYEMLTGQIPFRGGNESAIIHSILNDLPRPARELRAEVPAALERVMMRVLEKNRDKRYDSASELKKDLVESLPSSAVSSPRIGRGWPAVVASGFVLALFAFWFLRSSARMRWARDEAIPEIQRLVQEGNYLAAFALASRAERYVPADPALARLWPEFSTHLSFETEPSGADVFFKPYESDDEDWDTLGRTPIAGKRIPRGHFRWRVEKDGFRTLERARITGGFTPFGEDLSIRWNLTAEALAPKGMIPIPGGSTSLRINALDHLSPVDLPDYWIDRFEVTNREFQAFVNGGGYQNPAHWIQPFTHEGRERSWDEAIPQFRDATGRTGPSTWELGRFPRGKDDHPVSGVSWFEAAAYCEFAGKRLPTAYHWSEAAGTHLASYVISRSNIEGKSQGLSPVGSWSGISVFGAYDMAGNAREWCSNEGRSGRRYLLGGAWNELSYMFIDVNAQSPWDRTDTNGFRCIKTDSDSPLPDSAAGPLLDAFRDYTREVPVSDEVFRIYRSLYSYDATPLNASVESVGETTEPWKTEKVSFDAAYGSERVIAYLFLPWTGQQPYQTVVVFPGANAIFERSFPETGMWLYSFLVESGRAVLVPIYKGTFERGDALTSDYPAETSFYREHAIQWANDLGRSIDYVKTRGDIDSERLAFYGVSWGASQPQLLVVEDRFKAAILIAGGLYFTRTLPEVDPIHFAPRVKLPVLMLNGRSDYFYPVETSQEPLFRMLGTPAEDKRHVVFESGHAPPRNELIRETLDWLDRYLGPVR